MIRLQNPYLGSVDRFEAMDQDLGQNGMIAPQERIGLRSATAPTANRAYLLRFLPSRAMTVDRIAFSVTSTTAIAGDEVDVGLYDAAYAKIVTSGATTGKLNSTGVQTVTFTATPLAAGTVYYAAISMSVATANMWMAGFTGNAGDLFGTAAGTRICAQLNTSHPLPSSLSTAGVSIQAPLVAVRES